MTAAPDGRDQRNSHTPTQTDMPDRSQSLQDGNDEQQPRNTHSHVSPSTAYTFPSQQATHDRENATSGSPDFYTSNQTNQANQGYPNRPQSPPVAFVYHTVEHHETQQQAVDSYPLQVWRTQSINDEPLRIIPELSNPGEWNYWTGDGDNSCEQISDTEATGGTGGGSPNQRNG
ncbi:hypothetical protein F4819DRAFT_486743 [Hypoxylon fuscum]|nr:hypothetical protein F4819DRAFT_486743 [Hypoxylon fuscum]